MGETEQAGQQLATGQVPGGPEQHDHVGLEGVGPGEDGIGSSGSVVVKSSDSAVVLMGGRCSCVRHGRAALRLAHPEPNHPMFRFCVRACESCVNVRVHVRPGARLGRPGRAGGRRGPRPLPGRGWSMIPGVRRAPATSRGQPTQTSRTRADEASPHSARVRQSMAVTGTSEPHGDPSQGGPHDLDLPAQRVEGRRAVLAADVELGQVQLADGARSLGVDQALVLLGVDDEDAGRGHGDQRDGAPSTRGSVDR